MNSPSFCIPRPVAWVMQEAFAVVREASQRVLGLRPFDVQLIGMNSPSPFPGHRLRKAFALLEHAFLPTACPPCAGRQWTAKVPELLLMPARPFVTLTLSGFRGIGTTSLKRLWACQSALVEQASVCVWVGDCVLGVVARRGAGGMVLHKGEIAEMRTGEGKTLVAVLPAYLNALSGKGVHVVTVNDYLARRDAEWVGQVHRFLGLKVGLIQREWHPRPFCPRSLAVLWVQYLVSPRSAAHGGEELLMWDCGHGESWCCGTDCLWPFVAQRV